MKWFTTNADIQLDHTVNFDTNLVEGHTKKEKERERDNDVHFSADVPLRYLNSYNVLIIG